MEEDSFPRGRPSQDAPADADKSQKQPDRGRSREKSGDKKRSAADSADFLFGGGAAADETKARSASKRSKKAKTTEKAAANASQSLLPLGGGGVVHPTNKEAWIEPLSFTKLAKGFKLLGCVRAVQDDLILFSLPNMWTGYMLLDDIKKKSSTDPEWSGRQMVQTGQMLSVVILKAVQEDTPSVAGKSGQRRRIQVTCLPNKMNPLELTSSSSSSVRGQVISVEDHGLLVDLGMSRRGFLPFDEIKGEYTTDDDDETDTSIAHDDKRLLHAGSIHDFTVRPGSAPDVKILPLSMPSKKQGAKQFLPGTHTPPLAALQPGTLVHAKVERVVRNGLCVSFGGDNGVFRGAIEVNHLGSYWVPEHRHESIEWKAIFESHRSLTARIVAVDAATKIVRLSLLPHILDLTQAPALPAVGSIFEDATVIRIDPGVGALLALPDRLAEDAMPNRIHKPVSVEDTFSEASRVQAVYVHISKAMDEKGGGKTSESTFSKEFAPSTKHSVRILGTSNSIDGIASGATSDSIISAHVLTHADLLPGKVYHNVPVLAQLNGGAILVDFGLGVRGLIPPLQLFDQAADSDYRTKMSKVKYAVGAKVDVRVLSVDVEAKRCVVTAKKSLIKADDVISSYDHIKLGDKGTGFISKVDDRGLSVTLFGGVYGRVTARSLVAELGVEDHKQNYQVGDVVHCRIVNIKKRKSRNIGQDDMDVDETDDTSRAYWELTLSLKVHSDGDMDLDPDTAGSNTSAHTVSLRAGAILPLKSLRIVELVSGREKKTGFVSGHAIVRIKSKFLVEDESESMLPYIECKLPYDQLLDEYDENDIESAESLDALAVKLLSVGKKIDREGLVMTDPRKSRAEYSSATGKLTVVSIRPKLVKAAKQQLVSDKEESSNDLILPHPDTQLYMGAKLQGYVAQIDARFGAFVRFLDGMTGLVPKLKGGNDMRLFSTVETRIVALDVTTRPVKILLSRSMSKSKKKDDAEVETEKLDIHVGDLIGQAKVDDLDFHRAKLQILDAKWAGNDKIRARVHCTMAESKSTGKVTETKTEPGEQAIKKGHPFYKWKVGTELSNLIVVAVDCRAGTYYIELTNRKTDATSTEASAVKSQLPSFFFAGSQQLVPGLKVSGIVSSANQKRGGLWINLSPGVSGFLPALELSLDPKVLNNLEQAYPVGSRLECSVMDKLACVKTRAKLLGTVKKDEKKKKSVLPFLTLLHDGDSSTTKKPIRGDLVVGRINRSFPDVHAPALMLELRGGYVGRCCITEIEEVDDWGNMPFGRVSDKIAKSSGDQDGMDVDSDAEDDELEAISGSTEGNSSSPYPQGMFVQCRVMSGVPSKPLVDVSLRASRIEGDLDEDEAPEEDETIQAYVVSTNKKGCFLRLTRQIEGRVILKELCDGFLPDPAASFPMGRLVIGKVKGINKITKKAKASLSCKFSVDLDMRESILLDTQKKLKFEEIELGGKHKGTVTRIEDYGVFVRLENSDISGLVHKSECSDNYIKDLKHLYDPGDLVKVLILKKDDEKKQLGFSMKASHFEDDEDSDDDDDDEDVSLADDVSDRGDGADLQDEEVLDSDDDDFATKLSIQMEKKGKDGNRADASSDSESESDDSSSDDDSVEGQDKEGHGLDTNVGFDWGGPSTAPSKLAKDSDDEDEEDDSSEEEDNEDAVHKSSHKSRRKQAQRRRDEQEISRREIALADGTADENPETTGDFERLLAGNPNSSEIWIRYMAFHLTLADIPAARDVAERAFLRIEFRQEREKLNVWCALLTLELKFGSSKSLQDAIDRACQHNNPKQVYLRVCEITAKEISPSSPQSIERADELFGKMCKKFKDKKQVWIAHVQYLLTSGRHEEAHELSKRALKSLPSYKHVETMSKFAQLVFEYGTAERARTLFDGLLLKHPKRLDLFFVYVDKEVKHGEIDTARSLFQRAVSPRSSGSMMKLSDKQMKSLFKKWYSFEENSGDDETQERVKNAAREYVERSSK